MSAIRAEDFTRRARALGIDTYVGVPCSYLGPLIDHAIAHPSLRYLAATNEGDAAAIAAGIALAGQYAAVLLQNSGLGNAVNPLSSLHRIANLPTLLVIGWRGEPGPKLDEPQHRLMGTITTQILDLLGIDWKILPSDATQLEGVMSRAKSVMRDRKRPYALLVREGVFGKVAAPSATNPPTRPIRAQYLAALQAAAQTTDAIVATTGYTGRELAALDDRPSQFYLVGAMGCASSVGLGLALASPERRIIVLDGDGAALMRLSALATLAAERPRNLLHILFDNEAYESTGNQATVSHTVDLAALARAAGYPEVVTVDSPDALASLVRTPTTKLTFAHIKIPAHRMNPLPRPERTPPEVAQRFTQWMTP